MLHIYNNLLELDSTSLLNTNILEQVVNCSILDTFKVL